MYLKDNTLLQGGKYKIVRHISSGGFGNTYEAVDVNLDKRVAIKEFFVKDFCSRESDTTLVTIASTAKKPLIEHLKKKFIEEARTIAKMEYENIVKVQTLFEENGTAYYVMDYIDGESLSALLKRRDSLPENEALPIILKVADALGYMHKQNRFHLDVKPANIMLRNDGKVILIDFGSSKQYAEVDGENTTTLAPCYTPGYAPSEQITPKPTAFTAATDIYALGATLYKMLTGQTPPSAIDILNGEETLSPLTQEISQNVKECVEKAMIPQRNKRLQSTVDFIAILKQSKKSKNSKLSGKTIFIVIAVLIIAFFCIMWATQAKMQETIEPIIGKSTYTPEVIKISVKGVSFDMIEVEGGTFRMGATSEQGKDVSDDEKPVHEVTLSKYYIGKYEVTQDLWKAVMGNNPSKHKGNRKPVDSVSWDDCQEFISKLNSITGRCFRLPTEAEWEFAARGGTKSRGYKFSGSDYEDDVAWLDNSSHDVGTKIPNELGIYDMSGSISEWCRESYYEYSSEAQTNPVGHSKDYFYDVHVVRDGRSSQRSQGLYEQDGPYNDYYGLRLVLSWE